MDTPYHVYILESAAEARRHYTGFTEDVHERLRHHNAGQCPHTSKFRPWHLKTFVSFTNRDQALDFERYLKTHSGRAFAIKRL